MTSIPRSMFVYWIALMSLFVLLIGCSPSPEVAANQANFTETAAAAQPTQAAAAADTPMSFPTSTATAATTPGSMATSTPTTVPSPAVTATPIGGGTGQLYLYNKTINNDNQTWLADLASGATVNPPDNVCSNEFSPDGNWLWCWRRGSFYIISRDGQTRYPFDSLSEMLDVVAYWLPDSQRLILLTLSPNPDGLPRSYYKLNVVNRDGTGLTQIDHDLLFNMSSGIDLSPDGNYVVYQKYGRDIFVARTDGSDTRKITKEYENNDPFWSAKGDYIFLNREMLNSAGPSSIYRIKPDGSDLTLIFDGNKGGYWIPVCKRPASKTVLVCQAIALQSSVTHLIAIDLENPTAEPRILLEMKSPAIGNLMFMPAPDWSKIFVVTYSQEPNLRDYWIVNVKTGEQARLPDNVYRCESYNIVGISRWSPDSRLLALNGTVAPCQSNQARGSGMNIVNIDENKILLSLTEPPFDVALPSFWVK